MQLHRPGHAFQKSLYAGYCIFFYSAWRRHASSFTDFGRLLHPEFGNPTTPRGSRYGSCLGKPVPSVNPIVTILIHNGPQNMTAGVVVLRVTCIQPVKLPQHRKYTVIQNSAVCVDVELTMNLDQGYSRRKHP